MKKYFLSMLAMAAMLLIVSCSKDDTTDADKNATVSFDITTSELATRAYGDGTKALHLMYAVYDETTLTADGETPVVTGVSKLEPGDVTEFSNLKTSVNLSLLSGNEYSILFWAAAEGYDDAYTILWDEKYVVMKKNIPGNVEAYDSFFWYEPKFKVNGSISKPITLARPFAQLNIGTNDKAEAILAGMEVTETKVVVKNVPTILDVTNGNVAVEGDVTYEYGAVPTEDTDNKFHVDGYNYLAMNYVLAGEDKIFSDIVLSHKSATKEFTNTYPSIPLQRNHRTNVYGSILTNSADYEVNIEDEFGGNHNEPLPEYNRIADGVMQPKDELNTYLISSVEGMAWVAANVGDDGFAGKTIKLANDIDLKDIKTMGDSFAPIGSTGERDGNNRLICAPFKGTFDGQGHTISNLYQSGWDMGYEWGKYGSLGLFAELEGATVKNVVLDGFEAQVEGGDISFIAGSATGDCVFENIEIKDSKIGTYNNGCGGIIGWSGAGTYTFKNIKLGSDVVLGGLWGSFDSSIGGIVGQAEPGATYNFENVEINCRIDAYNDCTASYDYYNYRMCGMIIGRCEETTTIDGVNYPDLSKYNLSFNNVVVNYGDWMNYHYCEPTPGHNGGRGMRVEPGFTYGGLPEDYDHSQCTTNHMLCIPFDQLIGGDQIGVKGLKAVDGVTVNYPDSFYKEVGSTDNAAAITAIKNAIAAGLNVKLITDVDFGTEQFAITSDVEVDLNGHTLKTAMTYGGISLKNGASIKNGTIEHSSTVAAIKAFNVGSIENVTIKTTCSTADKTITAIAVQEGGKVGSIKDVTIEGVSQGIEVGYQATVDLIENVNVKMNTNGTANGIGMVINGGKVVKAKKSTFEGGVYGISMLLKGVFDVGLELEECEVKGTTASIYALDEKGISNTSGSLTLTYDDSTKDKLTGEVTLDFEDECKGVVTVNGKKLNE